MRSKNLPKPKFSMSQANDQANQQAEAILRFKAKAGLRRQMTNIRGAIPKSARDERAEKIAERSKSIPEIRGSRICLAYVPFRSEVNVSLVTDWLRAEGKTVVWPRVDIEGQRIAIHRWDGDLISSAFGIPEPPESAEEVNDADIDLVFVPALAIDPRGHRIGYGKGLYDSLLPRLRQARRIALLFDFQLIAEAPNTPGDERVHQIITDKQVIECRAES
jgi:5-formyltetrahydrofolate cyclo-ligase